MSRTPGAERPWLLPAGVTVLLGALVGTSFAIAPERGTGGRGVPRIVVSRSDCGQGWTNPHPGAQAFDLSNTGQKAAEVRLVDPASHTVYGEVEGLGRGSTRRMHVTLGNGRYAFQCIVPPADPMVGPVATVTGGAQRPGPAVVPVTAADLLAPLRTYHGYVRRGLARLVPQVQALRAAATSGDRARTKAAWRTAHAGYERLGAAYDAFGDTDAAIGGSDRGLAGGVRDEEFTGFHRIEHDLWHGADLSAVADRSATLAANVRRLRSELPDLQVDPNDLGLRAHEILENTLQFELSGKNDYGSGSTLSTTLSNVDGTVAVLDALRPVLAPRYPALPAVDRGLARVRSTVESLRRPDGTLPAATALPRAARARVNAAVDGALERLAPVAAICAVRRAAR